MVDTADPVSKLRDLRDSIDNIDAAIVHMLAERFRCTQALGAAIPSAVALTTEYSPKRLRATFVLAIYCGFSLGFVAAGGLAAWIIPLHG